MKRAAKRAVVFGAVALGLLAVLGAWLVGTESGFRAAWRLASGVMPAQIEVGALDGRIIGPLVITDLRYRRPDLLVRIERIELEWRPRALFRRVLSVERLRGTGIDVVRLPAAEPSGEPFRLPERVSAPLEVDVASVAVEDLRFRSAPSAEPLVIDDAQLALRFDDDALAVNGLDASGPLLDLAGRAEVGAAGRHPVDLELAATVRPPGRPVARAALRGSGTLDELVVQVGVEAPYAFDADVVVADVLDAPALDGTLRARVIPAEIGLDGPVAEAGIELAVAGRSTICA